VVAILGGTGLAVTGLVFTDERFVPDLRPLALSVVSGDGMWRSK
jgi:hypothetical protein